MLFPSNHLAIELGLRGRKFRERELGIHVKNKRLGISVVLDL